MPFSKVLVQNEILIDSSRIWTGINISISYEDKHYAKCDSHNITHGSKIFIIEIVLKSPNLENKTISNFLRKITIKYWL